MSKDGAVVRPADRLALTDADVAELLHVDMRTVQRHMRGLARNIFGGKRYPREVVQRVIDQAPPWLGSANTSAANPGTSTGATSVAVAGHRSAASAAARLRDYESKKKQNSLA